MNLILIAVISLGAIALVLAAILYVASKKFAVYEDPRIAQAVSYTHLDTDDFQKGVNVQDVARKVEYREVQRIHLNPTETKYGCQIQMCIRDRCRSVVNLWQTYSKSVVKENYYFLQDIIFLIILLRYIFHNVFPYLLLRII